MIDRASLPDFELPATGNQRFQLSAFNGHPSVPLPAPGHARRLLELARRAGL